MLRQCAPIRPWPAWLLALALTGACTESGTLPPPPAPPPTGRLYFTVREPPTNSRPYSVFRPHGTEVLAGQPERIPEPYDATGSAAISPDGRTLAFEESSHIVAYDLKTGQTRDVTNGRWPDRDPAWSPDGRLLLVRREPFLGQPRKLVLLNADGSGERDLFAFANDAAAIFGMGWSADGQWIYLVVTADPEPAPKTIVYRVAVNAQVPGLVKVTEGPIRSWHEHRVTGQIAVLLLNATFDSIQVAVYRSATQRYTKVGSFSVAESRSLELATWSPDGRYLAVLWSSQVSHWLLLFDVDGRRLYSQRRIDAGPEGFGFSWGPWPIP